MVERRNGWMQTSFMPGGTFTSPVGADGAAGLPAMRACSRMPWPRGRSLVARVEWRPRLLPRR